MHFIRETCHLHTRDTPQTPASVWELLSPCSPSPSYQGWVGTTEDDRRMDGLLILDPDGAGGADVARSAILLASKVLSYSET